MKYSIASLAEILAQIVQFSRDNFTGVDSIYPEDVKYDCGYICACFLAQHTPNGNQGVETEAAIKLLKIDDALSYSDRLKLARKAIKEFS